MKELDTIFLFVTGFNDMRHKFTFPWPSSLYLASVDTLTVRHDFPESARTSLAGFSSHGG